MDRVFLVRVVDDGIGLPGFDPEGGHFGLIGMRERALVEFWLPGREAVIVRVLIADDDPLIRDVLRDVLDDEPDLQVVAFSACCDAGAVDEMRRAGVTHHLAKGVRNTELADAVRRLGVG